MCRLSDPSTARPPSLQPSGAAPRTALEHLHRLRAASRILALVLVVLALLVVPQRRPRLRPRRRESLADPRPRGRPARASEAGKQGIAEAHAYGDVVNRRIGEEPARKRRDSQARHGGRLGLTARGGLKQPEITPTESPSVSPRVAAAAAREPQLVTVGERGERLTIELVTETIARVSFRPDGAARLDRTWSVVGDADCPREGPTRQLNLLHATGAVESATADGVAKLRTASLEVAVATTPGDHLRATFSHGGVAFAADRPHGSYLYDSRGSTVRHYVSSSEGERYLGFGEPSRAARQGGPAAARRGDRRDGVRRVEYRPAVQALAVRRRRHARRSRRRHAADRVRRALRQSRAGLARLRARDLGLPRPLPVLRGGGGRRRRVPRARADGARGDAAARVADGTEPPAAAVGARVHGVDDGVHRGRRRAGAPQAVWRALLRAWHPVRRLPPVVGVHRRRRRPPLRVHVEHVARPRPAGDVWRLQVARDGGAAEHQTVAPHVPPGVRRPRRRRRRSSRPPTARRRSSGASGRAAPARAPTARTSTLRRRRGTSGG